MSRIPLHWVPGDRCAVGSRIGVVVGVTPHLVTLRMPSGTYEVVARSEAELPPAPRRPLARGDRVEVLEGPTAGRVGVVLERSGGERWRVRFDEGRDRILRAAALRAVGGEP